MDDRGVESQLADLRHEVALLKRREARRRRFWAWAIAIALVALVSLPVAGWAVSPPADTLPFQSGDVISSQKVNSVFTTLYNAVTAAENNDVEHRVVAVEIQGGNPSSVTRRTSGEMPSVTALSNGQIDVVFASAFAAPPTCVVTEAKPTDSIVTLTITSAMNGLVSIRCRYNNGASTATADCPSPRINLVCVGPYI